MVRIYYDKDISLDLIKDETIAIIGYGNQGRAQALNLRDSKLNVIVGLRYGPSWELASKEGFKVYTIPEATKLGTIIMMLIPDMIQAEVYKQKIAPYMKEGKTLCFAHGFNIHYGLIKPPSNIDVIMVAPKSPGALLRENFIKGSGVPALIAVHQDSSGKAKDKALAIAKALGCGRVGIIETTFKDETESDLIGEQNVLVGGIIELIKKGFEVLVEEGYPPELAYFEACNEMKLIVDLIYRSGITGMLKSVSETARYGGLTMGRRVIDEHVKEKMKEIAKRVKSGEFAKEWLEEYEKGMPTLNALMKEVSHHPLEEVGERMRKMAKLTI